MKTGLNNVVLPTLFNVVNNIEQVVEPESNPKSSVTMLNNTVDNIEQWVQHNIVQSCFLLCILIFSPYETETTGICFRLSSFGRREILVLFIAFAYYNKWNYSDTKILQT